MTTALKARLDRAARIIRGDVPASKRKERKARRAFSRTLALMTVTAYAEWINGPDGGMMTAAEHWAQYGITTAPQLGDYLNGCVRKERRKDAFNYPDDVAEDFGGSYGADDGEGYTFDRDRAEGIAAEKAARAILWDDVPF